MSTLRMYKSGDVIFREGDHTNEMFFINQGKVKIEKLIGNTLETLSVLEKGDFFGEMALLEDEPRLAQAVAVEDALLLVVTPQTFEKLLASNTEIAIRMIRKYAKRLRETTQKLTDAGAMPLMSPQTIPVFKEKAQAQLISTTGHTYGIDALEMLVGRHDPVTGFSPAIDLTQSDPQKSVSRRHVKIKKEKLHYILKEELGVSNGTWINEKRILQGEWVRLKHGDHIQLGNVFLTFEMLE